MPPEAVQLTDRDSLEAAYAKLLAEKERVESELQLRDAALHAATSHFLVIDVIAPDRPIVFASQALAARHGFTVEQMIGMKLETFRRGSPNSGAIDAAMNEGRAFRTEIHFQGANGAPFSVQISLNPIRNAQGHVTHYVSVGADITAHVEAKKALQAHLDTETKQREHLEMELRLAQKLEAVGRLAAGIAHEINTPIQYVGDSVHFLRSAATDVDQLLNRYRMAMKQLQQGAALDTVVSEMAAAESAADSEFIATEVPKAFERTLEGVHRVETLVRGMKDFAHPHSNEQGPADINHAILTTATVASNEYKYCATVVTHFAELAPVMCNINELNQVFLNLIVNAAHAIQETGKDASTGRIEISTALAGDYVEVVFADNGCGIPQQNLDRIFDPFFTTKEVGKGTGQGLALTRNIIVDKHAGEINVQSTIGAGTRFILRLPIGGRPQMKESAAA